MIKYKQRGIALAVTLIILVILVVFGLTLGTLGIVNLKKVKSFEYSTAALYAAKAGAAKAINELYSNANWIYGFSNQPLTSAPGTYTVTFGTGKYDSTNNINSSTDYTSRSDGVTVPAGYCYIVSKGTVNGFNKYVAVMANRGSSGNPPWNYALFGYDSLEVGGTGDVNGDIGTNAASANIHGSGTVTGDTRTNAGESMPQVTDPLASSPPTGGNITSTATLSPGKYGSISLSGGGSAGHTVTLSAGTYSFTSIDLQSKGKIAISSGPVYIYVSGNIFLTGQSVTNTSHNAANCLFYGTSTCTSVAMRGGSDAYYGVYAPNATVSFAGNSALHGSAIGRNAVAIGTAAVVYDSNLSNLSGGGSNLLQIQSWQLVY